MPAGISGGSGLRRSARFNWSIQLERGRSSFQMATGALAWPVHAISSLCEPSMPMARSDLPSSAVTTGV